MILLSSHKLGNGISNQLTMLNPPVPFGPQLSSILCICNDLTKFVLNDLNDLNDFSFQNRNSEFTDGITNGDDVEEAERTEKTQKRMCSPCDLIVLAEDYCNVRFEFK